MAAAEKTLTRKALLKQAFIGFVFGGLAIFAEALGGRVGNYMIGVLVTSATVSGGVVGGVIVALFDGVFNRFLAQFSIPFQLLYILILSYLYRFAIRTKNGYLRVAALWLATASALSVQFVALSFFYVAYFGIGADPLQLVVNQFFGADETLIPRYWLTLVANTLIPSFLLVSAPKTTAQGTVLTEIKENIVFTIGALAFAPGLALVFIEPVPSPLTEAMGVVLLVLAIFAFTLYLERYSEFAQ